MKPSALLPPWRGDEPREEWLDRTGSDRLVNVPDDPYEEEVYPMRIKMTATTELTDLDGIPVRVWDGVTDQGIECIVFVHRVAVRRDRDQQQFEQELEALPEPERVPVQRVFDRRMF